MNTKPTYISKDGLEKLRQELDEMVSIRRPEIAQRIHDAKEHGDLTENAEYEDAKNEQAFVEGRIQTLEALIKNATIIDENHSTDHVQVGSTVKVDGDPKSFVEKARAEVAKASRGFPAPLEIVACVEAAATKPFDEGRKEERERFAKVIDYHSYGREVLYAYLCLGHPFKNWMQSEAEAISIASGYGGLTRLPSADSFGQ